MKLRELFNNMCDYTITPVKFSNENAVVNKISWMAKEQTEFLPSTLYFVKSGELPEILPAAVTMNVIFFGNSSIHPEILRSTPHNFFYLKENNDAYIRSCFDSIHQLLDADNQVLQELEPVLHALWNDKGLPAIVNIAAQILGNPVYITDMSYKFLAHSADHSTSGIIDEELIMGFISKNNVNYINRVEIDRLIGQKKQPYYFINEIANHGMMVDKIKIHGIEVAHLMVSEISQPITELHKKFVHYLSKIISNELQKNSFYKDNKGVMYSYFLAELLDNNFNDPNTIQMRLNTLGIKLLKKPQLLVSSRIHSTTQSLDIIVKQLNLLLPGSMYVIYKNTTVLLLNHDQLLTSEDEVCIRLNRFLTANMLTMGISNPITNISQLPTYYKQALKAEEIGNTRLAIKSGLVHFKDISLFYMLEISHQTEAIKGFCHPDISSLMDYDKLHQTELSHTLMFYLFNGQNTAITSQQLHIHKNTLLYRINKIKTILGSSLDDGNELFSYQLTFKILNYLSLQP